MSCAELLSIVSLCFFFNQKTAYEMLISDWSSDVCSSDLAGLMNPTQIAALRDQFVIAEGGEWEPYGGLGDNAAASLQAFVERSQIGRASCRERVCKYV